MPDNCLDLLAEVQGKIPESEKMELLEKKIEKKDY